MQLQIAWLMNKRMSSSSPLGQEGTKMPQDITTTGELNTGFTVVITIHTGDGWKEMYSPERLREVVGKALDDNDLAEEIDYTLEVSRRYE